MNMEMALYKSPMVVVDRERGAGSPLRDYVAQEMAVTVYINGWETATLICSLSNIRELVVGFLCGEGIVSGISDMESLVMDTATGRVDVEMPGYTPSNSRDFMRRYFGSSCGRSRTSFYFAADATLCERNEHEGQISSDTVFSLMEQLEERSALYRQTGGAHCAALADGEKLIACYEDVGRHNTLDKLLGHKLLEGLDTTGNVIVFSGRVSSEIVLKVSKLGCPILIARSAPTELALILAEDLAITVIGFSREERFNLYTHHQRILTQACIVKE